MELDKRIVHRDYIFDCFSTDKAKKYENCHGYFTDYMECFNNLNNCYKGTLKRVYRENSYPYFTYLNEDEDHDKYFHFFLPEEFVMGNVKKEKKFRPYTKDEFQQNFTIGLVIRYRNKIDKLEKLLLYVGYERCVSDNISDAIIIIGDKHYTLDELFKHYEVYDRYGNWVPFGVEE